MDILQNKPVQFFLTDRDICLLHKGLIDIAKIAIKEAPPDEGYAWAKLAIQIDKALHDEELCASGNDCAFESNKRAFQKEFKDFIKEEIKPYNQTR